jgi:endonuclease VIII
MSEGPEVKRTADKISEAILRKTIDNVYCKTSINNEFWKKVIGSEVKQIETFGKNIVIVFSNGIYLRNHMLMWGKWRIYSRQQFDEGKARPPPRRKQRLIVRSSSSANGIDLNHNRNINNKGKSINITKIHDKNNSHNNNNVNDVRNDSRVRLILFTKDKVAGQFNGPIITFSFENPAYIKPIVRLGPDPLRSDFDINNVHIRLNQITSKSHKLASNDPLIADLLLDQTFVAGIGNKYKSEILFLSKLYPFDTAKDRIPKEKKTLLQQIPTVLKTGYLNAGRTRPLNKDICETDIKWKYSYWVFRRGGQPCWICGTRIITDYKSSARVTFWCPTCQHTNK